MTAEELRAEIVALLDPSTATAVLDIGCGKGEDLLRIGKLAPNVARLVGVDSSEKSIATARAATQRDPRYSFVVHDVSSGLPFGAAEFDRVLSVNLLECVPDKHRLLREVHRVLTPTSKVALAHWDWDSQTVDGDDKDLVRTTIHRFGDLKQAWMADVDAWMGRRLWRTFQASGLFDGEIYPYVLTNTRFDPGTYGRETIDSFRTLVRRGMLSHDAYDSFRRALETLAAADQYFYSITMFVYLGAPTQR